MSVVGQPNANELDDRLCVKLSTDTTFKTRLGIILDQNFSFNSISVERILLGLPTIPCWVLLFYMNLYKYGNLLLYKYGNLLIHSQRCRARESLT
jgi:hypothetical protein